jgi:hypothetical protein
MTLFFWKSKEKVCKMLGNDERKPFTKYGRNFETDFRRRTNSIGLGSTSRPIVRSSVIPFCLSLVFVMFPFVLMRRCRNPSLDRKCLFLAGISSANDDRSEVDSSLEGIVLPLCETGKRPTAALFSLVFDCLRRTQQS